MTRFMCLFLLTASFTLCAQAQDTRGIVPIAFAKARPAKGQTPTNRRTVYRRTSAQAVAASQADEWSQLGLTIWRLRPATAADPNERIIVQKKTESVELIPERMPANAPLRIGENIRFSFESPQTGYLYVIDRELYADGSMSEPLLIFPTLRTRKGDNKVEAGKLIEIPAQEDGKEQDSTCQSQPMGRQQSGHAIRHDGSLFRHAAQAPRQNQRGSGRGRRSVM